MKKLLFILTALLATVEISAKDSPESYHIKVIRTDGTSFEGYNNTLLSDYLRPKVTEISVSTQFGGEPVQYTGNDVRRVIFTATQSDTVPKIFDAVKAQSKLPNLFSKNPKPYKQPVFLRLVYDGENVRGYAMPYTDHTMVPGRTTILYTWRYFYLTKDSDVAKAYWDDTDGVVPGMKKVMKFYFREFPEIVKMVDNGELTPEMFQKNPAMILPLMDKLYKPAK